MCVTRLYCTPCRSGNTWGHGLGTSLLQAQWPAIQQVCLSVRWLWQVGHGHPQPYQHQGLCHVHSIGICRDGSEQGGCSGELEQDITRQNIFRVLHNCQECTSAITDLGTRRCGITYIVCIGKIGLYQYYDINCGFSSLLTSTMCILHCLIHYVVWIQFIRLCLF